MVKKETRGRGISRYENLESCFFPTVIPMTCFYYVDLDFALNGRISQINQLEKDKDVIAQAQAIAALEALPQISFSVVNALSNLLADGKVPLLSFRLLDGVFRVSQEYINLNIFIGILESSH